MLQLDWPGLLEGLAAVFVLGFILDRAASVFFERGWLRGRIARERSPSSAAQTRANRRCSIICSAKNSRS